MATTQDLLDSIERGYQQRKREQAEPRKREQAEPRKPRNPLLAYWDSFAGLIPCKVIRYDAAIDPGFPACVVAIITADRGCYRKGERIAQDTRNIWPRDCVRRKRGTYGRKVFIAPYNWRARLKENS